MSWKNVATGVIALLGAAQLARLRVSGKYRKLYEQSGALHGVDANILHAIALQETRERPDLISPPNRNGTRDYGLMQINSVNLSRLGLNETTALVPGPNVEAAAKLVAQIKRGGINGLMDIFSVYNAGVSSQDADPTTPGFQQRPKLDTTGLAYFNEEYVRGAFNWYLLVTLGAYAPIETSNWS